MEREKALQLIKSYIKNENMIKHCLASEAVLKALAQELNEDEEKWSLAKYDKERRRATPYIILGFFLLFETFIFSFIVG